MYRKRYLYAVGAGFELLAAVFFLFTHQDLAAIIVGAASAYFSWIFINYKRLTREGT